MSIKKIVIVGPESTGKTTLCRQLATHYHSLYCPEYAREYLLTHGKSYEYDDLLTIAKAQLQQEDTCIQQLLGISANRTAAKSIHPYLFIDTDMERRLKLYHYYKDLLVHQATPWAEISGNYEERLQQAIAATDALYRGRMAEQEM